MLPTILPSTAFSTNPASPPKAATSRRPRARKAKPSQWETVPARETMPHYQAGCGPSSFRHGIPPHERAVVDAAIAILGRYLGQPGAVFNGPDAVKEYLRLQLANEARELFGALWLDSQHRAIAFEVCSVGTLTQTTVHPRELARAALVHDAAAVVLCHNHPSGSTTPSTSDRLLTQTLKSALGLVDCKVLDHIIIGREAISMAELQMV